MSTRDYTVRKPARCGRGHGITVTHKGVDYSVLQLIKLMKPEDRMQAKSMTNRISSKSEKFNTFEGLISSSLKATALVLVPKVMAYLINRGPCKAEKMRDHFRISGTTMKACKELLLETKGFDVKRVMHLGMTVDVCFAYQDHERAQVVGLQLINEKLDKRFKSQATPEVQVDGTIVVSNEPICVDNLVPWNDCSWKSKDEKNTVRWFRYVTSPAKEQEQVAA